MTQANEVRLRISVDGSSAKTGLSQVETSLGALQRKISTIEQSSSALTSSISRMGHAAAAAFSGREIAQAADAWASLSAQLKIAAGSSLAGAEAYGEVKRIALQTGQALTEVGNVYKRFADNATTLGISQQQVAAATETVAQAIALSGGSAAGAQAALVQFGQGLASGTLRGEELNSVLEQAPRLARALADGLGVPVGKLRELAEAGQITSEAIVKALAGSAAKVADEFGQLPVTIGRAMTNLQTAFTDTVGSFEKSSGVFSAAAKGIDALATHMDALATAAGVLGAVAGGKMVAGLVAGIQAKVAATAATQALAAAELREAQAQVAQATARAAGNSSMGVSVAAMEALTVANNRLAAAQVGAAAASRGAMVLGALGGPIGIVTTALMLGVTAWSLWRDKTDDATREAARSAAQNIDSIINKLQEMNSRLGDTTRTAYEATVKTSESELKTVRANVVQLQTELDKLDGAGGQGRFSARGKDLQAQLNTFARQEIELQGELGKARQKSAEVGTDALIKFIDANAVGAEKVRVSQTKLLNEFAAGIAKTGGVFDSSNPVHQRARAALDAGLADLNKKGSGKAGGGSSGAKSDESARLLEGLREKIALGEIDLASTEKLTAAEKERAKVKLALESGTLKASAAQQAAILGMLDDAVAQEKALAAQEDFRRGVEQLEATNVKQRQSMVEQAAALERSAETYGLTESAVSSMVASELEEAIAIASLNGARQESIDFLDEELDRRNKLTKALEKNDLARLLSGTKTEKDKKTAADVATLDRALAKGPENGGINQKQYDEAVAAMKDSTDQMTEFAIQAARNMQDAFADFLFDPFAKSASSMAKSFADTVRKMAAQALSAQILNKLFGDMGTSGKAGGLLGDFIKVVAGSFGGASAVSSVASSGFSAADLAYFNNFKFANGGIMTSAGSVPLNKYAGGGIATSPQLALFGEGSMPEAYVPLPDGRSIPVAMQGGGQPAPAQNIRIVNAFDTSVVGDYMGSAAGDRVIMNAVRRNAGAFRQAMA